MLVFITLQASYVDGVNTYLRREPVVGNLMQPLQGVGSFSVFSSATASSTFVPPSAQSSATPQQETVRPAVTSSANLTGGGAANPFLKLAGESQALLHVCACFSMYKSVLMKTCVLMKTLRLDEDFVF